LIFANKKPQSSNMLSIVVEPYSLFGLTGILASLLVPLGRAKISIFAV